MLLLFRYVNTGYLIFGLKRYDKFAVENKVFLDVYKISKLPSGVNIIVIRGGHNA